MSTTSRRFPAGSVRVSDAERDRALAELSDHYQAGRISAEEFDDRSGLALQARTGKDLSSLFDDLPPDQTTTLDPTLAAGWGGRPVPDRIKPGRVAWPAGRGVAVPVFRIVVAVAVVAVLFGWVSVSHRTAGLVVPLLIILLIVRRIIRSGR
jgi:hypothetical protein